jgi:hypothetical protein
VASSETVAAKAPENRPMAKNETAFIMNECYIDVRPGTSDERIAAAATYYIARKQAECGESPSQVEA